MSSGDTGLSCFALPLFSYDTGPCFLLWRIGPPEKMLSTQ